MNRLFIYIAILFLVSCTTTKSVSDNGKANSEKVVTSEVLDRTKVPTAGPAPEIKIGAYQTFQLENGLKVYVVENSKLPRVAFSLRIDRGPVFEGDKAGYTSIVASLLSRGTATKSKAEIDETVDFIGASFTTTATGMYGSSLTKHKEGLLSIMQDVLLNPTFPEDELEKIKKLELSNLISGKDDPATIVSNIRGIAVYGKEHPYGEIMTEKTLQNINREDCIQYFNTYWSPKSAYLAIVGDISMEEAKTLANQYFGSWKGGDLPKTQFNTPKAPEKTRVVLVDRPQSVQSEIRVSYPLEIRVGDDEFLASSLLNQILGGGFSSRLMQNLREDKGYTYGVGSGFTTDKVIGRFSAGGSVRNEVTDSAVYEIMKELKAIVEEGITEAELKAAKAFITGSFARSLEEPQTIAGFAISTAINGLPPTFYPNYLKKLDAVTVNEVNAAAKKYILPNNANIIVVGKAEEISNKLKKFGPIQYYDVEGNTYDPVEMNKALEGMNPKAIIQGYIDAIGGETKLAALNNQVITWDLDFSGQKLALKDAKTADGKFRQDILMQGILVQQVISDGADVATFAQGAKQPMDENAKMAQLLNNRLFPELYFDKSGVQLAMKGMEVINGSEAYIITLIFPNGEETQVFFDKATGLKVKDVSTVESPMGQITRTTIYKDYKEINGIMYAHTEVTNAGPQSFTTTLSKIEMNTKLANDYFDIK
jgi:predicted Zn-dependent peptidase